MRSHPILIVGESPYLPSGEGRVVRELLSSLAGLFVAGSIQCFALRHPQGAPTQVSGFELIPDTLARSNTQSLPQALVHTLATRSYSTVVTLGDPWTMIDVPNHLPPGTSWIPYINVDGVSLSRGWASQLISATCVVSSSQFGAREARRLSANATVHTIPFGINAELYKPLDDRSPSKLVYQVQDRFVVGCVAQQQPRKQLPRLVAAFAKFARSRQDAYLLLHARKSALGSDLPGLLDVHDLQGRAGIVGGEFLPGEAGDHLLSQLYNAFDVFALPTMGEGFGFPMLEAMACGVPVVATRCSAVTELVRGRGELIRVREKLIVGPFNTEMALADVSHLARLMDKLYQDAELRAQYAKAGRSFAETMTWERCAQKWAQLLAEVASAQPHFPSHASQRRLKPATLLGDNHNFQSGQDLQPVDSDLLAPQKDVTSVVILNHNTWEECTRECLERVRHFTTSPYEVILVDNGSSAQEVERIRACVSSMAGVKFVENKENLGYPAGNNCGLQHRSASSRLVCFLNSDCFISERAWNAKALRRFNNDWRLGAMSLTRGEKCYFFDSDTGNTYSHEPLQEPYDCEWVNGACLVVDCSRVKDPAFDEAFTPGYWEDVDLSFQIRIQGWSLSQRPDFNIVHLGSRTVTKLKGRLPYQGHMVPAADVVEQNRLRFIRKWNSSTHMLHPRLSDEASRAFLARLYKPETSAVVLERAWEPRRRPERPKVGLGIGIITYNRLGTLMKCVEAIERHTRTPFHLVVADDGSSDGSSSWARECGIPVVTGRNLGCAWNKNRALGYLLNETQCDPVLLLEDDCWPEVEGWEKEWIQAASRWGHVNYAHPNHPEEIVRGTGTSEDPFWTRWRTGQCTVTTRESLEELGYLDTRFSGWGLEHVEWTHRHAVRAGWPYRANPALSSGLNLIDAGTYANPATQAMNDRVMREIAEDHSYRPSHRNVLERDRLAGELARAGWPSGRTSGQPELVSIICPTKTPALARRMAKSLGPGSYEIVWVWNGFGPCPLLGRSVEYREQPFLYEEAVNRGAMAAQGDVLLIINDDVTVTCPDLPQRVLELYAERPELGACYGRLPGEWKGLDAPEAPHWEGGCWAISKQAFHAMGGLEESLTRYGGDEFVTRVRMKRLGFEGARLRGWTYEHPLHSTYGEADVTLHHVSQLSTALGYIGIPEEPTQEQAQQAYNQILADNGLPPAGKGAGEVGDGFEILADTGLRLGIGKLATETEELE